jgi:hypothetical protein
VGDNFGKLKFSRFFIFFVFGKYNAHHFENFSVGFPEGSNEFFNLNLTLNYTLGAGNGLDGYSSEDKAETHWKNHWIVKAF